MALSKKEMEFANYLVKGIVDALKENSANSQPSAKGRKSANEANSSAKQKNASSKKSATSEKKTATSDKKLTIKDFEPKGSKCEKGYTNWNSYSSQRTKYCYFVATKGEVTDGKIFGTKFYQEEWSKEFASAFAKAKEAYSKKYHYVKVADR